MPLVRISTDKYIIKHDPIARYYEDTLKIQTRRRRRRSNRIMDHHQLTMPSSKAKEIHVSPNMIESFDSKNSDTNCQMTGGHALPKRKCSYIPNIILPSP